MAHGSLAGLDPSIRKEDAVGARATLDSYTILVLWPFAQHLESCP